MKTVVERCCESRPPPNAKKTVRRVRPGAVPRWQVRTWLVCVCHVAVALFLNVPSASAGTSVSFVVTNHYSEPAEITFSDTQNCLEPSMMAEFIGNIFLVAPNGNLKIDMARRNGHGCNGENAVFSAYARVGDMDTGDVKSKEGWRGFSLTGSGGLRPRLLRGGGELGSSFRRPSPYWFQWELSPKAAAQPDDKMQELLRTYAPLVHLAQGEDYTASSVEASFQYLTRVERQGRYWLYTKQALDSPTDGDLEAFKGQGAEATAYGFYVRKTHATDLVYFVYYPYNRGKHMLDSVFGNHVGDWENIVVRLDANLEPTTVYLSQHDKGQKVAWDAIAKHQGTHPIVYAANGSHANYATPADHKYHSSPDLIDKTSAGLAWDTQINLAMFDFSSKRGLGGRDWPLWMNFDYNLTAGSPSPTAPEAGAIYRWGNGENGCGGGLKLFQKVAGVCLLEDGPTGPIDKWERWDVAAHCFADEEVSSVFQTQACKM